MALRMPKANVFDQAEISSFSSMWKEHKIPSSHGPDPTLQHWGFIRNPAGCRFVLVSCLDGKPSWLQVAKSLAPKILRLRKLGLVSVWVVAW